MSDINYSLLIDEGNTRTKFAIFNKQNGDIQGIEFEDIKQKSIKFSELIVASVKRESHVVADEVLSLLSLKKSSQVTTGPSIGEQINTCHLVEVHTPDEKFGLKIAYKDKTRLGVDRWLAMLSAFKQSKNACLVLDWGTAFKVDAVNNKGLHLGGWILPGYYMSESALLTNTNKIEVKESLKPELKFGQTTESCIHNGVFSAYILLVKQAVELLIEQNETKIDCYLTGGDACLFLPILKPYFAENSIRCYQQDDLIFRGLSYYSGH